MRRMAKRILHAWILPGSVLGTYRWRFATRQGCSTGRIPSSLVLSLPGLARVWCRDAWLPTAAQAWESAEVMRPGKLTKGRHAQQ